MQFATAGSFAAGLLRQSSFLYLEHVFIASVRECFRK